MRHVNKLTPAPSLIVASVALVVAIGGVAWATIPDAAGTIHGCYQSSGGLLGGKVGALRVIDTAKGQACQTSETPLNFNQQGPIGPAGPAVAPHGYAATCSGTCPSVPVGDVDTTVVHVSVPAGRYLASGTVTVCTASCNGNEGSFRCGINGHGPVTGQGNSEGTFPVTGEAVTLASVGSLALICNSPIGVTVAEASLDAIPVSAIN